MLTTKIRKWSVASIAAITFAALPGTVHAVLVAPGGFAVGVGPAPAIAGNILNDTTFDFQFADVSGTIEQMVVRRTGDASGQLDFYFQLTMDPATAQNSGAVSALTFNTYTGFSTDVFFTSTPPGGVPATSPENVGVPSGVVADPLTGRAAATNFGGGVDTFSRTNNGSAVQFTWNKNPLAGPITTIASGQVSPWMLIRTNATEYAGGSVGITNSLVQNFITLGPVPEPSTVLFGLGLIVTTFGVGRRRKGSLAM